MSSHAKVNTGKTLRRKKHKRQSRNTFPKNRLLPLAAAANSVFDATANASTKAANASTKAVNATTKAVDSEFTTAANTTTAAADCTSTAVNSDSITTFTSSPTTLLPAPTIPVTPLSPRKQTLLRHRASDESIDRSSISKARQGLRSRGSSPRATLMPAPPSNEEKISLFKHADSKITLYDDTSPSSSRIVGHLLGHGEFEIFQLHKGDVTYLACGPSFVYPLLPKLRMLRVSFNEFVLPLVNPERYWRVHILTGLPTVIDSLESALSNVISYRNLHFDGLDDSRPQDDSASLPLPPSFKQNLKSKEYLPASPLNKDSIRPENDSTKRISSPTKPGQNNTQHLVDESPEQKLLPSISPEVFMKPHPQKSGEQLPILPVNTTSLQACKASPLSDLFKIQSRQSPIDEMLASDHDEGGKSINQSLATPYPHSITEIHRLPASEANSMHPIPSLLQQNRSSLQESARWPGPTFFDASQPNAHSPLAQNIPYPHHTCKIERNTPKHGSNCMSDKSFNQQNDIYLDLHANLYSPPVRSLDGCVEMVQPFMQNSASPDILSETPQQAMASPSRFFIDPKLIESPPSPVPLLLTPQRLLCGPSQPDQTPYPLNEPSRGSITLQNAVFPLVPDPPSTPSPHWGSSRLATNPNPFQAEPIINAFSDDSLLDSLLDEYDESASLAESACLPRLVSQQFTERSFVFSRGDFIRQSSINQDDAFRTSLSHFRSRRSSRSDLYTSESNWMEPNLVPNKVSRPRSTFSASSSLSRSNPRLPGASCPQIYRSIAHRNSAAANQPTPPPRLIPSFPGKCDPRSSASDPPQKSIAARIFGW